MENIPAHRDFFQFIEILRRYSNFKLLNWLQSSAYGYDLTRVVVNQANDGNLDS